MVMLIGYFQRGKEAFFTGKHKIEAKGHKN